ncbi:MAG: 1-(5-phosphoribosyl)-5-[(5-phosphoribosylamino)methylideneamino] imidazole-4-carboxamide isomerase, partial [Steroidobacteraceae bacterium]|nr:1-(5-phosphoribosyl)-5-[(5-phosphoribosylamino)methylideneamino] imidazole-4-carboxamide isomerase [Steroidobacteraceae bacterium]MDW8258562.1 1-(5-phosphoribosyl)-5-[(5-phosphoribosylamino)methylideneamino] imidazole-4-carboxamide isomerase [Gammaproteobacteria bacterium]
DPCEFFASMTLQLIPAIDLRNGRCVRLLHGDFDRETVYAFAPHELMLRYRALGARWLHIVDLDGARDGRLANRDVIVALATQSQLRLQVGGGARDRAVVDDLLRHGVDRVVVGSAAIEAPQDVVQWLQQYGAERLVLAFDVRHDATGVPRVHTRGWRRAEPLDLWTAVECFAAAGARHVLCTDIDRDGTLSGPNIELYAQAQRRFPQLAWQASGGVRDRGDLEALAQLGIAAAISGKALLEERLSASDLRAFLPDASRC